MDDTGRVLSRARELAEEFLAGLDARPVWPTGDVRRGADNALTPAAAEVVAGEWIVDALGLPAGTAVGFVTGGMWPTTPACRRDGTRCWPLTAGTSRHVASSTRLGVRLVVGRHRHDTVDRAARYLGLGQESVVDVDTDDQGRISVDALEGALAAGDGPTIEADVAATVDAVRRLLADLR